MGKEIIDYECPHCGSKKSYLIKLSNVEACICVKCDKTLYSNNLKDIPPPEPEVKCPYCGSLNTEKITKASKVGSFVLWGVFAIGKSTKEWHCNRCNSDF